MGERANIIFFGKRGGICLYSHWAGPEMADAAMKVLENPAFRKRLGDYGYATRIGVQTVLEFLRAESDVDTGFGLYPGMSPHDANYGTITINVDDGSVYVDHKKVENPTLEKLRALICGDE